MLMQFDTSDEAAAVAALLVYATWRSRDQARFRITPDVWAQVERLVKASAKRAQTLPAFIEALKPRLLCGTLQPRWLDDGVVAAPGRVALFSRETGALDAVIELPAAAEGRPFLTGVVRRAPTRDVLRRLYAETAWIILLVRDRLERERPYEAQLEREDVDARVIPANIGATA